MRTMAVVAILAVTGCGRLGFEAPDSGSAGDGGSGGDGGGDGGGGDGGADATTDGMTVTCGTQMMCAETSRSFLAGVTGMITDDGTTAGDATQGSCGGGGGAGDFGVQFTVTPVGVGRVRFQVDAGFDTVLYVFNGTTCTGMELACEDVPGASGETYQLDLVALPRSIVLVVDGKGGACGPITLSWGP